MFLLAVWGIYGETRRNVRVIDDISSIASAIANWISTASLFISSPQTARDEQRWKYIRQRKSLSRSLTKATERYFIYAGSQFAPRDDRILYVYTRKWTRERETVPPSQNTLLILTGINLFSFFISLGGILYIARSLQRSPSRLSHKHTPFALLAAACLYLH